MYRIRAIEREEVQKIREVVEIHLDAFPGFFLTFLGNGFLWKMYLSYCEHPLSGLLVAVNEKDQPVGFLAYSADLSGLYKFMIKHHLCSFAWYAFGAFFKKPGIFLRLIRAFLKPGESRRQEAYVELASIGVRQDMMNGGVGTLMIDALKKQTDFEFYQYIALETDAVGNEGANMFYQKNGFLLERTYQTPEGRKMNEYRYRG